MKVAILPPKRRLQDIVQLAESKLAWDEQAAPNGIVWWTIQSDL
jgi:hypothetical protein